MVLKTILDEKVKALVILQMQLAGKKGGKTDYFEIQIYVNVWYEFGQIVQRLCIIVINLFDIFIL